MSNYSSFISQRRFGSLDGLRAISIIAVIWHHTAPNWVSETLTHVGTNGVTLFFAISGFLITTLLLREQCRTGTIDLKAFYLRRTLRIFPLYYGVLLFYTMAVLLLEKNTLAGQTFFENLKYFATFTSNIMVPLEDRTIFYFSWSVAAEEQFYLLWPSVLLIIGAGSRASMLLCAVLIACALGDLLGSKLLSAVPVAIIVGALLAIVLHTKNGFRVLESILGRSWSFTILAFGLVIALTIIPAPNFLIHTLFAAIVGSCVLRESHPVAPLLSLKPIAYIGSISYGMYMLHMLCKHVAVKLLEVFRLPSSGLEVFALTLILAVVAATLSFRYYESVFLKLKKKYQR